LHNLEPSRPELHLGLGPPPHHVLTLLRPPKQFLRGTAHTGESIGPELGPLHLKIEVLLERLFPSFNGLPPCLRTLSLPEPLGGPQPLYRRLRLFKPSPQDVSSFQKFEVPRTWDDAHHLPPFFHPFPKFL